MDDQNPHDKNTAGKGVGAVGGAVAGGVIGGATAGALAGGVTGPVGAAIGAAVGAVAGAVMKKSADPVVEDTYWRDNHSTRPYARKDVSFDHYQPAYRAGVDSYNRNPGRSFDEIEPELGREWGRARGSSSLEWEHARPAARDAFDRVSNAVERAIPGDSDKDGR